MKKLLLLVHQGIGDHLNMIGGVRHFATMYDEVYYLVVRYYLDNVRLFYEDVKNIHFVVIESFNYRTCSLDFKDVRALNVPEDVEIRKVGYFIDPLYSNHLDKNRKNRHLNHLPKNFYDDLGVDFSHFRNSFSIPKVSREMRNLQEDLKSLHKKIIFIHDTSSSSNNNNRFGRMLKNVFSRSSSDTILINVSENMYENGEEHYEIAKKYVNLPLLDYAPIIYHANEVHVSDSSFFCLALQIVDTARQKCVLYPRTGYANESVYHYIDKGWMYVFLNELQKRNLKKNTRRNINPAAGILGMILFLLFLKKTTTDKYSSG